MGRIDLNVNPVHIRFRNKETGKMRWMRCREYSVAEGRTRVTVVKKGHEVSEWFGNEWEIERTDAPEGSGQITPQSDAKVSTPAPVLAFTPRGSENPNAPQSPEEAAARRDDPRKIGNLKTDLSGEYNAWAHVDKANPMGEITGEPDEEKRALALIKLNASIAAEATRQEAMNRMRMAKAKRQLAARLEVAGVGFEP